MNSSNWGEGGPRGTTRERKWNNRKAVHGMSWCDVVRGRGTSKLACCGLREWDWRSRTHHKQRIQVRILPSGSDSKESAFSVGDLGSNPGLGRSPGRGHGNPLQYSCLENPHGQRSLAGYSPWAHKEWDTTGRLSTTHKDSANHVRDQHLQVFQTHGWHCISKRLSIRGWHRSQTRICLNDPTVGLYICACGSLSSWFGTWYFRCQDSATVAPDFLLL